MVKKMKNDQRVRTVTFKEKSGYLSFPTSSDHKRSDRRCSKSSAGFTRLDEMYEMGRSKIIVDRERYKKNLEKEAKLVKQRISLPKVTRQKSNLVDSHSRDSAGRHSRLYELYEVGKSKVRVDRERHNKKDKECDKESESCLSKRSSSNGRQNQLYALSKQKQILGKKRRDEVEKANKSKTLGRFVINSKSVEASTPKTNYTPQRHQRHSKTKPRYHQTCNEHAVLSDKNTKQMPNSRKRWDRLYELSKSMQESGKGRRHEIENRRKKSQLNSWKSSAICR